MFAQNRKEQRKITQKMFLLPSYSSSVPVPKCYMVLSDFRSRGFSRGSNCYLPDSVDKKRGKATW